MEWDIEPLFLNYNLFFDESALRAGMKLEEALRSANMPLEFTRGYEKNGVPYVFNENQCSRTMSKT